MGHSSISVTMDIYGHLFPSDAEELADKLDELFRRSQTDKIRTKPSLTAVPDEENDQGNRSDQGVLFVPAAFHNANRVALVEGESIQVTPRHGKVRRDGYRR